MPITLDHTIIAARGREASVAFYVETLGLDQPTFWGPFATLALDAGVTLQFYQQTDRPIVPQHYAFRVDDERFDQILGRIQQLGQDYWADPPQQLLNQINTNHGGRGFYVLDPSGHGLEILTASYA